MPASKKFEFQNLKILFRKNVSFLVVKTIKCKRGISVAFEIQTA